MRRSRGFVYEQRERAIQRKKRLSRILYKEDLYEGKDGKYAKCHIGCGCGVCKPTKRFRQPSFADMRKSEPLLHEIDEFKKYI